MKAALRIPANDDHTQNSDGTWCTSDYLSQAEAQYYMSPDGADGKFQKKKKKPQTYLSLFKE